MPSLSDHQSNDFTKLILLGDSKAGKTGSLVSLVKAGYKLRILDTDNLLEVLKQYVYKECPELINNIEYRTLRDIRKTKVPTAWTNLLKMLNHWKYDDVDLGPPAEWGPDCILVIDSFSRACDAALAFHEVMGNNKDKRMSYWDAQVDAEKMLADITSDGFCTNVILICHVAYLEQPDGTKKGLPQGVGSALSPKVPQYFPSMILFTNKGGKRTLQTNSTPMIDLANPKPFAMAPSYPIETGLADFFAVLREPPQQSKPKLIKRV